MTQWSSTWLLGMIFFVPHGYEWREYRCWQDGTEYRRRDSSTAQGVMVAYHVLGEAVAVMEMGFEVATDT